LESGDAVLFIGAGVGGHFKRPDGSTAPDGETLAKELCAHFNVTTPSTNLAKVAELIEIRKDRAQLEQSIKKLLADLEPDEVFRWLTTFHWRAVFTTNYDRAIERAYDLNPNPPQSPIPMSVTSELEYTDPRVQVPIFHLHGTLYGPNPSRIVITQTDYARFQDKRRMLWNRLKTEFATSTFIYVGYSGRDPNWQLVLDELTQEFYPNELPKSYRLDPFAEDIDVELLRKRQIETLTTDLPTFRDLVTAELGDFRPDPEAFKRYQKDIPRDLVPAFEKNPAATLRLLNSWKYINGVSFNEPPNTAQFLKGDRPSWSLVGAGIQFKRDIEEELWDDVLDFATTPEAKSRAMAILAPAGYGITTLLMSVGANIVKERIGTVFMLRDGADVLEGDIQFAATLFPEEACFFLVDQAREQAIPLQTALAQQRQTNRNCLFVLGERKNEWRMARSRMKTVEYEVQPLSDSEIDRLLDYLSRENALGRLGELDREFQFAIVKQKHEKQLLVAMREATEGTGFDAIIQNEYRGIEDKASPTTATSRDLYLLVSCFFQHGVLARDFLLANILGKPLPVLYAEIGDSLEGIVIFEETDLTRGEYAARTRHRTIADVVWKRCGLPAAKERILQSAMEKLNLSYRLDKTVFDKFVRTDEVVGSFGTLDGKVRFFETACKREPENPYVLQHFARMLLHENETNLALSQINAALTMNNSIRILHHTKGAILAQLAIGAESEDLGRKWMLQAEHEFRHCISVTVSDEYAYQSLAQLYLDWARKVKSEDEGSEYITRCEEVISEGLRSVREREALWVVSAGVQEWLGNQPSRIEKLKRAVAESKATVVPRYLLGRAYRQQGLPQLCIDVLDAVVKSRFTEVRSFIEYVRAMIDLGESYAKCAAVLSQCQVDGLNDPRFVGLYGGLLFLDGQISEAAKVFNESVRQGFSYEERYRTQYRPADPANPQAPLRMSGTIATVKPGYVFIQTSKYPDFISRITRAGKVILQRGMQVEFEPTFSAKGAYAYRVRIVGGSVEAGTAV
jgi:hypothetical protein